MTARPRPRTRRRRACGGASTRSTYRHRVRCRSLLLLTPPIGWMAVVYFGSLALLFVSAFWYLDPLTSAIKHEFTLQNFQQLLTRPGLPDDHAAHRRLWRRW